MKKIRLNDLSEVVRSFFAQASGEGGVMIEDDAGCARYGVVPYREASVEEKRQADEALRRLREHTGQAMRDQGVTEEDIDRALQEDD